MINIQKKIKAKWVISLGLMLLMGLANMAMLHGMEPEQPKDEFTQYFENLVKRGELPQEVQKYIRQLQFKDAIMFLGLYDMPALHTLKGHTDEVVSIAVAGDKVVTGSEDKTAKIWDINTGQLLHTLQGHTNIVTSVAVADDKVVTTSWDDTAKIWNINTGQLLYTLKGHTNAIDSLAVAGDKVVTGSWDNTAKIWNINTGQLLHTLQGHKNSIESLAVADDKVVTGSADNTANIWSLSINLQGTAQDNPLVWIMQNATIPQLDLINRAYKTAVQDNQFIIAFPSEDAKVFLSFPKHVQQYLAKRLNIRR